MAIPQVQSQEPTSFDEDSEYGGVTTHGEPEQEIIRLQLDVDKELKKFEHEVLRGMIEITDERTGLKRYEPIAKGRLPPVNELGVREILSRMKGRVTVIAKLSNKTDKEVYSDMFYFDMSITELIAKRSDVWDMDMEIAKSIKDSIVELVWDILCSSRDGFTAINLRSQYTKQDINRSDNQEGRSRSFLGIPMGKK